MSRESDIPYDEGMGSSERPNERINAGRERATNQFGSTISQTVDRQRENTANGLDWAASSLHDSIGAAAKMGRRFAHGIESTASYLGDNRSSDIGDDVITWCKRHPVPVLASAAVLGFLMSRCGANRRQQ
jgi:hypothetical protein